MIKLMYFDENQVVFLFYGFMNSKSKTANNNKKILTQLKVFISKGLKINKSTECPKLVNHRQGNCTKAISH